MKYEAHITCEPHSEYSFQEFVEAAKVWGWKASKFEHDDVDGIAGKWFLSHASDNRDAIMSEIQGMVHSLESADQTVLRAKLEETLFDTKDGDKVDELVTLVVQRDLERVA